jgi:hypothetical protein
VTKLATLALTEKPGRRRPGSPSTDAAGRRSPAGGQSLRNTTREGRLAHQAPAGRDPRGCFERDRDGSKP